MKLLNSLYARITHLSPLYISTILFLFTVLVYVNSVPNGLFYDDEDFIYKNQYIINFDIPKFFTENLIAGAGKVSNYYRPVLMMIFSIAHLLFGFSPFVYHLLSIFFHTAAVILLFFLLYKLFGKKLLSFLTSLLFAIHPIQTEAVSYASGLGDPVSLTWTLGAILLSFSKKRKFFASSLMLFIFALLSKETTLITPLLIFLCHVIYTSQHVKMSKKLIFQCLRTSIPYWVITVLYFFLRLTILNFQNTLNFYNSQNIYTQDIFVRINTFINLIPKYISLLLYPHTLFIERPVTIYSSITPVTIIVIMGALLLLFLSIKWLKKIPLLLFSFLWFFISFIPSSGIIPINGIFYEHFAYFPSIGFFTLISFLIIEFIKYLTKKSNEEQNFTTIKRGGIYLLLILGLAYGLFLMFRTIVRNQDWHDPITFYNQTLRYTKSPRLYNNLAMAYAEDGNYKKSIEIYKKAIKEGDFYPQTHYNMGNSYVALSEVKNAEIEYKKALKLDKSFYLSYLKLFKLYRSIDNKRGEEWVLAEIKKLAKKNKNFEILLQQLKNT